MKLNYKRTFLVGLVFMSISAFWQMYDNVVPLVLKNTFNVPDGVAGVIMAMDNVIALFLLPLLGAMSDKTNTKIGRRMPYIVVGTILAAILMLFLPILDNAYFNSPSPYLMVAFIFVLGLLLIAMAIYRSPAVALMPDVTPKPLRSRGNAVINLMGAVGGIIYLIISSLIFKKSGIRNDYMPVFIIVAAIMLLAVAIVFTFIKEKDCVQEVKAYEAGHPEEDLEVKGEDGESFLPKEVKRSLMFILLSISLWFMGYNAISTSFSKFATSEWGMSLGRANTCLTIGMAVAILSYIPIGELASRIGRKKTIIAGVILLTLSFAGCFLVQVFVGGYSPVILVLFCIVGFSWASINVNSLPMVVEMCRESDIGKYTGYYYTFSMSAQIVTPILSGILLQYLGYWTLFPYGALFVFFSLLTMLQVKHGDNKPAMPKNKLEMYEEMDD